MHRHNVCHLDLCLPNMLLSFNDNTVVIADLGLAACASSFALERSVTQMAGRAPEVLFSHSGGDYVAALTAPQCSVDLWSLGVVVAALQVGQHLFAKENVADQLQACVDFLGPPEDT